MTARYYWYYHYYIFIILYIIYIIYFQDRCAKKTIATVNAMKIIFDSLRYAINISVFLSYILLQTLWTFVKRGFASSICFQYEKSARISRVLWRRKCFMMDITSSRDFLTTYGSCVHPRIVLNPNISLYAITKHEAVFVETPKNLNLFRSDVNPFLYIAQFLYCRHIITMPIQSFHMLATEIPDSTVPIIWLSNTGRCGSTIVGQIFESVTGSVLMSENDSLTNLSYLKIKDKLSVKEYNEMLLSIIKIICKPIPNTRRFCIKPRSCGLVHLESISRLLPNIKLLFLYRNALPTVSSFLALTISESALVCWRYFSDSDIISRLFPFFRKYLRYYFALRDDDFLKDPATMNTVEMFTSMWAQFIILARHVRSQNKNVIPIKYEEVTSDPLRTCKRVFLAVGIDIIEAQHAVVALQRDSQRGSVLSTTAIGKDPRRSVNKTDRLKADAILSKYNLPLMGEDCTL